ncbi:DUF3800 domain-containing protein, partial [Schumannella luteola]
MLSAACRTASSTGYRGAMLLFYIDESGHHRMDADPDDPTRLAPDTTDWFVLSAVGIRDTSRRPLAEDIDRIKRLRLGAAADRDWNDTELKGRRLAITRRALDGGHPEPAAYAEITDLKRLDALEQELRMQFARFRPLTFSVAIDKRRLFTRRPGDSALGWAYAFLYRRMALSLERLYPGEGGVLVADQQTEHEKAFTTGDLTRLRDDLAEAAPWLRADYRLLLDRPLWIDSTLSTWDREIIQLADLVAFTTHEGV